MSQVPYASVVGSLMYTMVCTKPYIAHAMEVLSGYVSNLGKEHSTDVKRIFRYVCGTANYAICYQGRPIPNKIVDVQDFVDADYTRDLN